MLYGDRRGGAAQRDCVRLLLRRICIGGGILIAVFLFLALFGKACLPFVLAYLFASGLQRPLAALEALCGAKAEKHERAETGKVRRRRDRYLGKFKRVRPSRFGRRTFFAVLLVFLSAAVVIGIPIRIAAALVEESGALLMWMYENAGTLIAKVDSMISGISQFFDGLPFPLPSGGEEGIGAAILSSLSQVIPDMLGEAMSRFSSSASSFITALARALPAVLLFFAVFFIAAVYMTIDYPKVHGFLWAMVPPGYRAGAETLFKGIGHTVFSMGKVWLILSAATFGMLFAGLSLLGVERPLIAALCGCVIDILPILGVGTLLLPWALLSFLMGNATRGVGLAVLYVIIAVVRQVLEPRLVGKTTGLYPLAALFAGYAGGVLFGYAGLFLVPLLCAIAWNGYRGLKNADGHG
ncbi:MAG: AI-2E family transporter [Clostridia bacterium]|nr:AI-2E family transporter [Clostridia bacterium]